MDQTLLGDHASVAGPAESLGAISAVGAHPIEWEVLKAEWQEVLISAGRDRRARITRELNEVQRGLRIIEGGGSLTFAMQDYVNQLRTVYYTLLRHTSRAACLAQA